MSAGITSERALIDAAEQQGLLPPEARAAWRDEAGSSWIVIVLTFLGAQLVVLPFLGFLALLSFEFFLRPPGAFVASAILIGGAVVLLRARPGMFAAQLAFSGLMAGLALLVVAFEGALGNAQLLIIFGVLIGAALLVRVTWVQRVLGFLAALVLLAVALWPRATGANLDEWQQWEWRFSSFPMALNAVLLALLWGLWAVRERAWSGRAASSALHALADGAGVALLVAVGDEVGDAVIAGLKTEIAKMKVGPGTDNSNDMGPLVTKPHFEKVKAYVDSGVAEGATLVVDGRGVKVAGHEEGYFLGACLFDNVKPGMKIYQEEIFGPVLGVVRVKTLQEAMQLINDHEYGNGTCIFTRDGEAARYFTDHIQVGMVGVNVPLPVPVAYHSFGGWKRSLFGDLHAYGPDAVRFYTKRKTITQRWPSAGVREGAVFSFPSSR